VSGVSGATLLSSGDDVSCAIANSAVECWGASGQVGNDTTTLVTYPVVSFSIASTTYSYASGLLASNTDANGKKVSYVYNYDNRVACVAYPVSTTTNCGTTGSTVLGSSTNTVVNYSYSYGRLSGTTDWLGNTVSDTYGDVWAPDSPTKITYGSSGLVVNYGYDPDGTLTSLSTSGTSNAINDTWTLDNDQRMNVATVNSVSTASPTYNQDDQVTAATNLATSTSNDTYTIAANGDILKDAAPSGATTSFGYNSGGELCWSANVSSLASCTSPPTSTSVTKYTYTANGQRASAATTTISGTSTTDYAWNSQSELCNVGSSVVPCGANPLNGASYTYDTDGLRIATNQIATIGSTTTTSSTESTWDLVSGGAMPLDINDAESSSASPLLSVNTSYLFGNLLFGGTAPVEQISGSTVMYLVTSPAGVQGVYSSSATSLQQTLYSTYGIETVTSGSKVTPYGFQGSYSDSTGFLYLINRYYDPTTDQFMSVDPLVDQTDQPYVFVDDEPLNATDPFGTEACGSNADDKGYECRTGYTVTVWAQTETTANGGFTIILTTAAVTVSGTGANTSVTMNFNPDGSLDVTVGGKTTVGVNVSPVSAPVPDGIINFQAFSGSAESHGVTISANVTVAVTNVPPPTSGGPAWLNYLAWGLGIGAASVFLLGFAAPIIVIALPIPRGT
jgi:RHS repeat-associated protein